MAKLDSYNPNWERDLADLITELVFRASSNDQHQVAALSQKIGLASFAQFETTEQAQAAIAERAREGSAIAGTSLCVPEVKANATANDVRITIAAADAVFDRALQRMEAARSSGNENGKTAQIYKLPTKSLR